AALSVKLGNRTAARVYLSSIDERALEGTPAKRYALLAAQSAEIENLKPMLEGYPDAELVAIVAERAWREGAYGLYHEARRLSGSETKDWKETTAAYLATGMRLDPDKAQSSDPKIIALSSAPQPSVYYAKDLRPLLETSAKVAGLAVTLTPMVQSDANPPSSPSPAGNDNQTENEQAL
ncbi:MAG: hypothetical protein V2I43_19935, partial [Parvularcula sp.]|nr:hypothetical protein [Parvularcula sp.]